MDNIGGGYFRMLEQGQKKKRDAMAIKNKKLGQSVAI
jgi:hypothetical protein